MQVNPLSEAKARLSHYAHLCHEEPVIVTVNGIPAFQLVPVSEEDDLVDQLLEHNPAFLAFFKSGWLSEASVHGRPGSVCDRHEEKTFRFSSPARCVPPPA